MTIAVIIGLCVLLFVLALLVPRLARRLQSGSDRTLAVGQRAGGSAPGPLGRLLQKPFSSSRKATRKSESAGERVRNKLS